MGIVSGVNNYLKSLPPSSSELVSIVEEVKNKIKIPSKVDDVTTLIDITTGSNTIRYHYVISSGVDTNNLSNSYMKNYLVSSVCKNLDTKNFLNRGINMEYSYTIEDKQENFFATLTKADCLN